MLIISLHHSIIPDGFIALDAKARAIANVVILYVVEMIFIKDLTLQGTEAERFELVKILPVGGIKN